MRNQLSVLLWGGAIGHLGDALYIATVGPTEWTIGRCIFLAVGSGIIAAALSFTFRPRRA